MKLLHICPTYTSQTCGIASYSRTLYKALTDLPEIEGQAVLDGFISAHSSLLDMEPDVCHVQLEYGFCSSERLEILSEQCAETNTKLVITFHTLAPARHNIVPAIRISHTPLSRLYGDFHVLPMAVPEVNYAKDSELEQVLGDQYKWLNNVGRWETFLFFGQAHPHKCLMESLEFFTELQARSDAIRRLVCIVSKPTAGSTEYYDQCKAYATRKGMEDHILWIEPFLTDEQILSVSVYCQTAIFPYKEYGSVGISAAVKLLMNNDSLSIWTSDTSHFSDLDESAGISKGSLEDMLKSKWILKQAKVKAYWVRTHRPADIAQLHLRLYQS